MLYYGCPNCTRKVEQANTGAFCNSCAMKVVAIPYYFIHAEIEDIASKVIIGFTRDQATELMGLSAAKCADMKEGVTSEEFDHYLHSHVLFQEFHVTVKYKEEKY